jgi:Pentapeptide repeats (8 copies)
VPRQGLRLTTRTTTVLCIAAILVLLIIAANFAGWTGFQDRTPWEYLDVFLVPAAVTVATLWFTSTQEKIALDAEERRAQDEALQAYLDKMSELLIDKELHKKADRYHPMRVTARARTLALLEQLDEKRKGTVLLFLREARLINSQARCHEGRLVAYPRLVGLKDADLKNAHLREARLISEDRREAVSLEGADLEGADLVDADLESADLRKVVLKSATLSGAILSGTDLSGADLTNATVTETQLATCKSLEGATMPDGQSLKSDDNPGGPTFEEWRKSKGHRGFVASLRTNFRDG